MKPRHLITCLAFTLVFTLIPARADDGKPLETPPSLGIGIPDNPSGSSARQAMTVVQGMAVTLGLLFVGLAVYSHKFKQHRTKPLLGDIEISGRLMLTPKTSLVLVRVSGRPVLCAVGPEHVSMLNAEPDVRAETAFYELVGRKDPTDEVLT